MRKTAEYTLLDSIRNEILEELHTPQKTEFIEKYRRNWKEHVGRMSADRIPKKILQYQPKGKRSLGRSSKQWQDSVI
jgi:hypothetical protein